MKNFVFWCVHAVVFAVLHASAQTVHTESYQLGMRIQDGIRKGDLSAFEKAFDPEVLANRTLEPLKLPDQLKQYLRGAMQPRATAEGVAEAFVSNGKNGAFVGVRRFLDEYHLLFRYAGDRDSVAYLGYVIGDVQYGKVTLVDVYSFAPAEMLSETIRRQCLLLLTNVDKSVLESLESKQKDFMKSQAQWNTFVTHCQAGENALAAEAYVKLPASLRIDKYVLFNRTRAALGASEADFLAALIPWRENYPKDPALEMFASNYYWTKNDDAKALAAFERLNELLGGDPKIDLRLARLHLELNQPREAKVRLWQAVQRDPPDASAFVALLQDTLSNRSYEETARALSLQEAAFGVDLKEKVKAEPTYEGFRQSPFYQAWLKQDRDQAKPIQSASTTATGDSLTLQGVMFAPSRSSALINGKTVFVGDAVAGYKVIKIEQQSVTLQTPAGERRVLSTRGS
jgi:hypothetical protein